MKTCTICTVEKSNRDFIRGNAHPICKKCHKASRKAYEKEYRRINKARILENNNKYKKLRRKRDPIFRLTNNCSRMINAALNGKKYNYSIWDFLPYTIDELKQHLEKQFSNEMTWDNYGSYWHIDHITPQSLLPYTSMEDDNFKKCWDLNNLQPLEAIKNIKKSNRLPNEII